MTRTPITLSGNGALVGRGKVIVNEVADEGSDVVSVDGIDGGSVEGGGVQASVVGPAHYILFA